MNPKFLTFDAYLYFNKTGDIKGAKILDGYHFNRIWFNSTDPIKTAKPTILIIFMLPSILINRVVNIYWNIKASKYFRKQLRQIINNN